MNPIVGIGELLWDVYPDGRKVAGGAPFNFAFHCHQLGHPAIMVSRVGDDDLGRELRAEVRRLGMIDEHIQTDPVHPTGTVTVQLDIAGQPTYTITEDVAWDYVEWSDRSQRLDRSWGVICYRPLGQRFPQCRRTIRPYLHASKDKSTLVCDINLRPPFTPAEAVAAVVKEADWLKLNQSEI